MALTIAVDELVTTSTNPLLKTKPHWPRARIREIGAVLNGFAFKSELFTRDGGTPLVRIRDVGKNASETFYSGEFDPRYIVEPGDLLVGMDGDFNCARWHGPKSLLNQRVCKITVDPRVCDRRWIDYVLPAYLQAINEATSSITVKHLSSRTIEEIPLPMPPIGEQVELVAEIEKQFSRLDEAIASLQRVKATVQTYKASVLTAAVDGKLVVTEAAVAKNEAREYESGAALLRRVLESRSKQWTKKKPYSEPRGPSKTSAVLPEGWAWASVEQLNPADRPCAYGVLQPGDHVEAGIPFVRVGDVKDGRVELAEMKRVAHSIAAAYPRTRLAGGEVLMTLVGAIGRTAVVPRSLVGANVARAVGVLPITPLVHAAWVEIWFRSPRRIAEMTNASHEVARKTLNLEDVRFANVALPPVAEQVRIIAEVERRLSIMREVEAEVDANLKRAEALRQALLARAFAAA
jgi:type I restriction enzyme, S subunit